MHNLKNILAAGVSIALAASATAAFAQAPAVPAAAAPKVPTGPAIAGVCIFSRDAALANSAVGKFVGERLKQIQSQASAEVQGELTALQTDEKAYAAQRGSLASDVQQQRETVLRQREELLQRKAELRNRELQATEQKALSRVVVEMNPLLIQVYGQRNCGLLLDQNATFGANPSMNITSDVVRLLDGKITQFAFEREHLEQAAAPAGGVAPVKR
jgi:Skp family chaperone for outer membrane proteins